MKLYLAGPMRGRESWNRPEFEAAHEALEDRGHEVMCPSCWNEEAQVTDAEDLLSVKSGLKAMLQWIVDEADAVAVLAGWRVSRGSIAEVALAQAIDVPVFTAEELLLVDPDDCEQVLL